MADFLNQSNGVFTSSRQGPKGQPITEVEMTGNRVAEQRTEAHEDAGAVLFNQPIDSVEIYNRDATDGVFSVNGIDITVPGGEVFRALIGGARDDEVLVTGSTSYIITRYE